MAKLNGCEETILSVLILGEKFLLIGLSNAMMVAFVLSGINPFTHLSIFLSLNPVIYRIGNAPNILCPKCKEQDESHTPGFPLSGRLGGVSPHQPKIHLFPPVNQKKNPPNKFSNVYPLGGRNLHLTTIWKTLLLHLTFYCKISKITIDLPELQKVRLKAITMVTSSQSHHGIHLKILPTLLDVCVRYLSYCRSKAFKEAYDKINEFSNF